MILKHAQYYFGHLKGDLPAGIVVFLSTDLLYADYKLVKPTLYKEFLHKSMSPLVLFAVTVGAIPARRVSHWNGGWHVICHTG